MPCIMSAEVTGQMLASSHDEQQFMAGDSESECPNENEIQCEVLT